MSKFIEEFKQQWGDDLKKVKEETRKILERGEDLAFEEYYKSKSLERLKESIRGK